LNTIFDLTSPSTGEYKGSCINNDDCFSNEICNIGICAVREVLFKEDETQNPSFTRSLNLVPNQKYEVFIEVMGTDMDGNNEYLEVKIDGRSLGKCNVDKYNSCIFDDCTQGNNEGYNGIQRQTIKSLSGTIKIDANFPGVDANNPCPIQGVNSRGIFRITLTPGNNNSSAIRISCMLS